ncbi:MAG: STAS domain-containing protein [Acidobacteria bacterium]|nr:STAS domain-containing protein [Acidobacteriota bacterium]
MINTLSQNTDNTPVTVRVERDLVASQSTELRDHLRTLISQGTRSVVLDFSHVRMVDSAGLGMIIAAHNSLKKVEGELAVTECSAEILELFRSMRIHQHMRVEGAGVASV